MVLGVVLCHFCFKRLCESSLIDVVGSVALGEFCLLGFHYGGYQEIKHYEIK